MKGAPALRYSVAHAAGPTNETFVKHYTYLVGKIAKLGLSGKRCIDIGTNYGLGTLAMASVGCETTGFEGDFETIRFLLASVS